MNEEEVVVALKIIAQLLPHHRMKTSEGSLSLEKNTIFSRV